MQQNAARLKPDGQRSVSKKYISLLIARDLHCTKAPPV